MKGTVQFNGSSSRPFDIRSGVKQGCVLAPMLFGIFFALLLRHVFDTASEGICLQTRSDGRLFSLGRLRAKTTVREALIRDMLLADDATVTTHFQQGLQALVGRFSRACKDFGLTINLKKTNVLGQDTMELPATTIDDYELDVVEQFTYLASTITYNLSLDTEIDKRTGKAAKTLAHLTSRVWTNPKLTVKTKRVVYNACVASTLMYGSETWTTYARQEKRLLPLEKHPPYPWHILARQSVKHRGPVPSQPSKHVHAAQTAQAALAGACLLHVGWPHPKRHSLWRVVIWKEIQRPPTAALQGYVQERHGSLDINTDSWEDLAVDCMICRSTLSQHLKTGGKEAGECRSRKKGPQKGAQQLQQTRDHTQMRLLWQRLFLPHRSLQPQAMLQQSNRQDQDQT